MIEEFSIFIYSTNIIGFDLFYGIIFKSFS
jgi:hypothetical protein